MNHSVPGRLEGKSLFRIVNIFSETLLFAVQNPTFWQNILKKISNLMMGGELIKIEFR